MHIFIFDRFSVPVLRFTRSFWAISAGDWQFALRNCPLSLGVYGLMIAFFAWHSVALLLGVRIESGVYRMLKSPYAWWIIAAVFFLNWMYRLSLGLR